MNIKGINLSEANLVIGLFDKYRVFYKKDSDIGLAERFIKTRLGNNESVIFVALEGDQPTGFTQLYPKYSSVSAVKNWILNDLYVDSNYRKQGIGEALIKKVMDFAKSDGWKFYRSFCRYAASFYFDPEGAEVVFREKIGTLEIGNCQ